MSKRAQAGEGPSPRNFSAEQLEKMTPREWWLKAVVAPNTPLQREQTPEEIGRSVAFLVSEDGRCITGRALSLDGFQVMH